jgi:hypothetical protein
MTNRIKDLLVYIIYGIIFLTITAVLYLYYPQKLEAMTLLGNVVQLIVPFFAGFAIMLLFNPRIFGDVKRSMPWMFIGLGFIFWALGQLAYLYMEVILRIEVPSPSIADIGYLLLYPFVFIGYFLQYRIFGRIKITSVLFYAMLSLFIGTYMFLVWGSLTSSTGINQAIQIAYIIGDIGFVVGASVMAYTNRNGFLMWPWIILAISASIFAYGNALYDYMSQIGTYQTGSFVDMFWIIAFIVAWVGAHLFSLIMKVRPSEE